MRAILLAGMIIGVLWHSVIAHADMYTWTDKDGNVHFSDTPPETGKPKKLQFAESERSLKEEARGLARAAYKASKFSGGPCNDQELGRIINLYGELYHNAQELLRKCTLGDASACAPLKIPPETARSKQFAALQEKYLPLPNMWDYPETGYKPGYGSVC